MANEEDLPADVSQQLAIISREARRTTRIVKNLLSFARKSTVEKQLTDINSLIQNIVELRAYELNVNRIRLHTFLSDELPEIVVDPDQIRQVFLNLINNAIHALLEKPGNRNLIITTEPIDKKVRISIKDNGIGIPEYVRKRIFDPFFTTKPNGRGTGLGLSISMNIVHHHGGVLSVNTHPGKGTEFIVLLPAVGDNTVGESKSNDEDVPIVFVKPCDVLVIDDETEITELLKNGLESAGCTVRTVNSGTRAMEMVERNGFDSIICDMRLPDIDGWEVFQWVKQNKPDDLNRFIFVTGDVLNEHLKSLIDSANIACVRKPFEVRDVIEAIAVQQDRNSNSTP